MTLKIGDILLFPNDDNVIYKITNMRTREWELKQITNYKDYVDIWDCAFITLDSEYYIKINHHFTKLGKIFYKKS
jgi:hypothetical protein